MRNIKNVTLLGTLVYLSYILVLFFQFIFNSWNGYFEKHTTLVNSYMENSHNLLEVFIKPSFTYYSITGVICFCLFVISSIAMSFGTEENYSEEYEYVDV